MENTVALITGAAKGIGKDAAIAFVEKGADVVITDIDKEALAETENIIKEKGGKVLAMKANVADEEDIQKMVNETLDTFGQLDYAVNNAGISGESNTSGDYSLEGWDQVLNVNLRGQFLCMKYEIEAMLKNGKGSIVNISSILGRVGFAQAPAYTASKHGLIGLTRTAAIEYAQQGIRVNAVCPAFIKTPLLEEAGIMSDKEMLDYLVSLHPMGRLGEAREVADAIVWLASDEASFVTGNAMMVDGGYTAR